MDSQTLLKLLLKRGERAATRLSRDPEVESIAGEATLRAIRTYDASKGLAIDIWVVYCVKMDCISYLRQRAHRNEQLRETEWFAERFAFREEEEPAEELQLQKLVSPEAWQLLQERFVEGWNRRAMARKRGVTVREVDRLLRIAIEDLRSAIE